MTLTSHTLSGDEPDCLAKTDYVISSIQGDQQSRCSMQQTQVFRSNDKFGDGILPMKDYGMRLRV